MIHGVTGQTIKLGIVCVFLALSVFVLDTFVPPRIAVDALYSLVIILSLAAGSVRLIWVMAWLCTVLLIAGHFFSPASILPLWLNVLNRIFFLLVIWITACLGVRLARTQRRLREHEAELQAANRELDQMAHHDSLTGVANRRYFNDELTDECRRAKRGQTPLSLLMIDVDNFKSYNDLQGHQAGDLCLIRIARGIEGALRRPGDRVARYGGEEFAVILPATTQEGAVERAEDIRRAIENMCLVHPNPRINGPVTVSVGVSSMNPASEEADPTALISAADAALYRAKECGKNCVRIASPRSLTP